jgi:hypothetical protein
MASQGFPLQVFETKGTIAKGAAFRIIAVALCLAINEYHNAGLEILIVRSGFRDSSFLHNFEGGR